MACNMQRYPQHHIEHNFKTFLAFPSCCGASMKVKTFECYYDKSTKEKRVLLVLSCPCRGSTFNMNDYQPAHTSMLLQLESCNSRNIPRCLHLRTAERIILQCLISHYITQIILYKINVLSLNIHKRQFIITANKVISVTGRPSDDSHITPAQIIKVSFAPPKLVQPYLISYRVLCPMVDRFHKVSFTACKYNPFQFLQYKRSDFIRLGSLIQSFLASTKKDSSGKCPEFTLVQQWHTILLAR